jgi:diguanylate cyclase (GGDEF)-like protein
MTLGKSLAFTALEILQLCVFTVVVLWSVRRISVLRRAAATDDLTGLPNRRGLHQAYAALAGKGTPPAVLLLDLTGFKQVNDGHGHDAGDDVLRHVASQLTGVAGQVGGLAGRLGGDEFALLVPDRGDQALRDAVHAVEQAFVAPAGLADGAVPVSAVIGAARPSPAAPADRPFRAADIALYHARHHRQPYAVYTPGMVHPAAANRHGPRLRDRRCTQRVVSFDPAFFQRLAAGQVSSDVAHNDDIADLQSLLDTLDPTTRHFGTDTADLVTRCLDHGVLHLHDPLTHLGIEATTAGEYRDGGFLVLVTIADAVTLASTQIHPRDFVGLGDPTAEHLLAVITDTAGRLFDTYRALAAGHSLR